MTYIKIIYEDGYTIEHELNSSAEYEAEANEKHGAIKFVHIINED